MEKALARVFMLTILSCSRKLFAQSESESELDEEEEEEEEEEDEDFSASSSQPSWVSLNSSM